MSVELVNRIHRIFPRSQFRRIREHSVEVEIGPRTYLVTTHDLQNALESVGSSWKHTDASKWIGGVLAGAKRNDAGELIKTCDQCGWVMSECVCQKKWRCPHGDEPAECEFCMRESDFQFESAREDRMFGR